MASCKDCIHHKSCFNMALRCGYKAEALDGAETCEDFKNKSDYAEVKHGEWERIIRNGKPRGIKCSLCGKHIHFHENFCPECGADMRGDTDGKL